jgi:intracellular sulfur oxidation DsrE/DsrF family protein
MDALIHLCGADADSWELALIRAELMLGADFDFVPEEITLLVAGGGVGAVAEPDGRRRVVALAEAGVRIVVERRALSGGTVAPEALPEGVEVAAGDGLLRRARSPDSPTTYLRHA